jgi:hypothetical protein
MLLSIAHARRLMSNLIVQDPAVGQAFSVAVGSLPDGPQKKALQVSRAEHLPLRNVACSRRNRHNMT